MTATIIQFPTRCPLPYVPVGECVDAYIEACNRCMAQRLGIGQHSRILREVLVERADHEWLQWLDGYEARVAVERGREDSRRVRD